MARSPELVRLACRKKSLIQGLAEGDIMEISRHNVLYKSRGGSSRYLRCDMSCGDQSRRRGWRRSVEESGIDSVETDEASSLKFSWRHLEI